MSVAGGSASATISLTFMPDGDDASLWNTPQTVTVYSVPDRVVNGDRSVRIKHEAHSGRYDGVTAESEVTIADDDTTGLIVGDPSGDPSEDGTTTTATTATISVSLNSEPTGNVIVTAGSANTKVAKVAVNESDGTGTLGTPAETASLTFTPTGGASPWEHTADRDRCRCATIILKT